MVSGDRSHVSTGVLEGENVAFLNIPSYIVLAYGVLEE